MPTHSSDVPDQKILAQAVDWMLVLQSGEITADMQEACERWQAIHPQHAIAWARVTRLQQTFEQLQHKDLARQVLTSMDQAARRKALKTLGGLSVLLPAAWLSYRTLPVERWRAEYQTAVGEQRQLKLNDGTRLELNTESSLDIAYQAQRQITLYRGELWLETGHQDARTLVVTTPHGTLTPLGTRFNVQSDSKQTTLAVAEGAVRISLAHGQTSVVHAGQQQSFSHAGLGRVRALNDNAGDWRRGMLLAQDMPLSDLLTELARYRHGVIRCHPDLKTMKVSGAFPLNDTDAALDLLQKTLPVRIVTPSQLWVMVEPAKG